MNCGIRPGKADGKWRRRQDGNWYLTMPSRSVLMVVRRSGWHWEYHGILGTCQISPARHIDLQAAQGDALAKTTWEESKEHAEHLRDLRYARRRGRKKARLWVRRKKATAKGRALREALEQGDDLEIARLMGWYKGRRRPVPVDLADRLERGMKSQEDHKNESTDGVSSV